MTEREITISKIELGKYKIPIIIQKIKNFISTNNLYDFFGFRLTFDFRYNITPLDIVPFAYTGGNGIHFGFLTDFGLVNSLDDAPIVIIAPTYDPPIRLVAKNLLDFLTYFPTIYDAEDLLIDDINMLNKSSNERWDRYTEEQVRIEKHNFSKLVNDYRMQFDGTKLSSVEEILENIEKTCKSRKLVVNIETADNVGVVTNVLNTENSIISQFDYSIADVKIIENYLETTNKNSRIMFYRDATYMYILSKDYDYEVLGVLKKWLKIDGFLRESEVINILDGSIT